MAIMGILRWYADESIAWQTRQDIYKSANDLDLKPRPWSSRTLVLTFSSNTDEAKPAFNKLTRWLEDRKEEQGEKFFAILAANLTNGYREI